MTGLRFLLDVVCPKQKLILVHQLSRWSSLLNDLSLIPKKRHSNKLIFLMSLPGARSKRPRCGAAIRKYPSKAAVFVVKAGLAQGKVLDFGCGHGMDADTYNWDGYDPKYRPRNVAQSSYDTILCTNVLNVLDRDNRLQALNHIQSLLSPEGVAYIVVPRNIPVTGKRRPNGTRQYYVVLDLPIIHETKTSVIYTLSKMQQKRDRTLERN